MTTRPKKRQSPRKPKDDSLTNNNAITPYRKDGTKMTEKAFIKRLTKIAEKRNYSFVNTCVFVVSMCEKWGY